jgi:predicted nucleic acid-binding protein
MVVWWGTRIECHSALRRREREGGLLSADILHALKRLASLAESWLEVEPHDALRIRAERILKAHHLRAADALQLAAAIIACGEQTMNVHFLTADARLAKAAETEGFEVE